MAGWSWWISSMKSTSLGWRFVRIAARSPARWITGPEVARKPTPISRATIWASVVLPRPGGPCSRTWSSASPRARAASMNTARFSRLDCWPTNSSRVWGRRLASAASSSRRAGETVRVAPAFSPSPCGRGLGGGGWGCVAAPSPQPPPARGGGELRLPFAPLPLIRPPGAPVLSGCRGSPHREQPHHPTVRSHAPRPAAPLAADSRD